MRRACSPPKRARSLPKGGPSAWQMLVNPSVPAPPPPSSRDAQPDEEKSQQKSQRISSSFATTLPWGARARARLDRRDSRAHRRPRATPGAPRRPAHARGAVRTAPATRSNDTGGLHHLTPAQVAELLNLTEPYVHELCRTGRVQATKSGKYWMIPVAGLRRWLVYQNRDVDDGGQLPLQSPRPCGDVRPTSLTGPAGRPRRSRMA